MVDAFSWWQYDNAIGLGNYNDFANDVYYFINTEFHNIFFQSREMIDIVIPNIEDGNLCIHVDFYNRRVQNVQRRNSFFFLFDYISMVKIISRKF